MKKSLNASLALLFLLNVAVAQRHIESRQPMADKGAVEIAANIGLNLSSVSLPQNNYYYNYTPYTYKAGMNIGVSAEYYFSEKWSIKGKIIYDPKGWGNDYFQNSNGDAVPTTVRANYLTIPLLASWHFGRTRNWYLHFGPYVGFLLNAYETTLNTDLKPGFNSTDFGLALGIGVKIPLSDKLKLFIEDDGQAGVLNIINLNAGGSGSATNTRTALNVGLIFAVK